MSRRSLPRRVARVLLVLLGSAVIAGVVLSRLSARDPGPGPDGLLFPLVDAQAYPFEHRHLEVPGGARIHYIDEGAGPTLLFLHGNPTWSFLYRNLIRDLRSSYRCVALDYPGMGLSTAPPGFGFTPREHSEAVEQFIEALGLQDVTLVVQDWGGPIGLGYAGRHPERVSRVVIANTWAWPADAGMARFSGIAGGPVGRFLGTHFNGIAHLFLRMGTRRKLTSDELEMYLRPFRRKERRTPTIRFPAEIVASEAYLREVEAGLRRLEDKPALILWGTQDRGFDASKRERFERTFRDHRTVLLEDAAHYVQEDAPERMVEEIRRFVPVQTGQAAQ